MNYQFSHLERLLIVRVSKYLFTINFTAWWKHFYYDIYKLYLASVNSLEYVRIESELVLDNFYLSIFLLRNIYLVEVNEALQTKAHNPLIYSSIFIINSQKYSFKMF